MNTETENAHRLRKWFVVLVVCATATALALILDGRVAAWFAQNSSVHIRRFMAVVSRIGDWPAHVVLGLALLAIAWRTRNNRWTRSFAAMVIACALAGVVARAGKIMVGRPRPSVAVEQSWNGPSLHSHFNAFPSGHTAASTAFFVTLFIAARWQIGAPFLIIPLLIALSRMVVAAHYLSDVVGGFAVGIIAALLVAESMHLEPPPSQSRR